MTMCNTKFAFEDWLCRREQGHEGPCHPSAIPSMTVDIPMPASVQPPKDTFEGGATRTKQAERYDLIPPAALRALARRLAYGAERHGERNWESGGEAFRVASASHLMAHLVSYMENPTQEDCEAIICNAAFLCHFQKIRERRGMLFDNLEVVDGAD